MLNESSEVVAVTGVESYGAEVEVQHPERPIVQILGDRYSGLFVEHDPANTPTVTLPNLMWELGRLRMHALDVIRGNQRGPVLFMGYQIERLNQAVETLADQERVKHKSVTRRQLDLELLSPLPMVMDKLYAIHGGIALVAATWFLKYTRLEMQRECATQHKWHLEGIALADVLLRMGVWSLGYASRTNYIAEISAWLSGDADTWNIPPFNQAAFGEAKKLAIGGITHVDVLNTPALLSTNINVLGQSVPPF